MKITVLMGGVSAERNVSLASGIRIVEALKERGHDVAAVDPAKGVIDQVELKRLSETVVGVTPPSLEDLANLTKKSLRIDLLLLPEITNADVLFLALHGGQGEDGVLQGALEMAGVPYTGSGHLGSAIAMDKNLSKVLFRAAGVNTADWLMAPQPVERVERELGFPVVVKPSKQGSTVGLTVVKSKEQYEGAVQEAFKFDDEVMIEKFVTGRELTVSVLGEEALPVGEIITKTELYDYHSKYTSGMAHEVFPANISQSATKLMQEQAVLAFKALKLRGYARADFRLTPEGDMFCLEVNTLPGMTSLSLLPQAAAAVGIGFGELCERIAKEAILIEDPVAR